MIAKSVKVSIEAVTIIASVLAEANKFTPEKIEKLKKLMSKLDVFSIAKIFECQVPEIETQINQIKNSTKTPYQAIEGKAWQFNK